jgi:hypothetical protein
LFFAANSTVLEERVALSNRSDVRHRFYLWNNAWAFGLIADNTQVRAIWIHRPGLNLRKTVAGSETHCAAKLPENFESASLYVPRPQKNLAV